mmetsp:Transcript_39778/g.119028  ORF Transcript_39778/g.119028 Transcript_39778/m.119028 type:complete len:339 (-) Transcript_39778:8-1024(-)
MCGTPRSVRAHLHVGLLPLDRLHRAGLAEGEAELLHQREAVGLGQAVIDDPHVEAVDQLPRVDELVKLPEGLLAVEAHPEVPEVVEGVRVEALEVAHARQDDGVQAVQEVVHQRALQAHGHAAVRALAPPERVHVVPRLHHPRVHARDAPQLLDDLVDDLRVRGLLGLQPRLDAHLEEAVLVPGLGAPGHELPLQGLQELGPLGDAVLLHAQRLVTRPHALGLRLIGWRRDVPVEHGLGARRALLAGGAGDPGGALGRRQRDGEGHVLDGRRGRLEDARVEARQKGGKRDGGRAESALRQAPRGGARLVERHRRHRPAPHESRMGGGGCFSQPEPKVA